MPDGCIQEFHNLRIVDSVLQKDFNFVEIIPFGFSHLLSSQQSSSLRVTNSQFTQRQKVLSPRDTLAQSLRDVIAQSLVD